MINFIFMLAMQDLHTNLHIFTIFKTRILQWWIIDWKDATKKKSNENFRDTYNSNKCVSNTEIVKTELGDGRCIWPEEKMTSKDLICWTPKDKKLSRTRPVRSVETRLKSLQTPLDRQTGIVLLLVQSCEGLVHQYDLLYFMIYLSSPFTTLNNHSTVFLGWWYNIHIHTPTPTSSHTHAHAHTQIYV